MLWKRYSSKLIHNCLISVSSAWCTPSVLQLPTSAVLIN